MSEFQKVIKYLAIGVASLLAVSIIAGILGAVAMFGDYLYDEGIAGEMKAYEISDDIDSLNIDVTAAKLTLKQADKFAVESNINNLKVEDRQGVLSVKDKKSPFVNHSDYDLVISIPKGKRFDNASITTGGGILTVDELYAENIECDFGAGEINIDNLFATSKANIDGGAGKITINYGELNNLDFDMGVGQLNFASTLTGESEFDLGVGESNINLIGSKDDYTLDIEKGLGEIKLDGDSVSSISGFGNGQDSVQISGGIGAINVNYQ